MATALLVSACGGGSAATQATGAASSTGQSTAGGGLKGNVVVGTWGGTYQQYQQNSIVPALHQVDPNLNVVFDANSQDSARLSQVEVEKNSKTPGTFDVLALTAADAQTAIDEGLLAKLNYSKMANSKYLLSSMKTPYWIAQIYSVAGVLYNTKYVKTPPTSWSALWSAQYKGKVGIQSTDWDTPLFAAAAYTDKGNPGTNWDVGWPILKKHAANFQFFPSQGQLGAALKSGQIWLAVDWKARYLDFKAEGAPLGFAIPKEGTLPYVSIFAIPKNAPDPAAGYAYLNATLAPSAQQYFANKMSYSPTVTNSGLPAATLHAVGITPAEMKLMYPYPYNYVASNFQAWQKEWQQYVLK